MKKMIVRLMVVLATLGTSIPVVANPITVTPAQGQPYTDWWKKIYEGLSDVLYTHPDSYYYHAPEHRFMAQTYIVDVAIGTTLNLENISNIKVKQGIEGSENTEYITYKDTSLLIEEGVIQYEMLRNGESTEWPNIQKISDLEEIIDVASVTFANPGIYFVEVSSAGYMPEVGIHDLEACLLINVVEEQTLVEPEVEAQQTATAIPSKVNVVLDGVNEVFSTYNINGTNYIKLRAFADAMKETDKKFNVEWNAERGEIELVPGDAYMGEVEEDLLVTENKEAIHSEAKVLLNGAGSMNPEAYNIDNSNYFKLRDLCDMLHIQLNWDEVNRVIEISTAIAQR